MREVAQGKFYAVIGPQNVHPSIRPGPWPYVSDWMTPARRIVGRSETQLGSLPTRYFLPD